MAISPRLRAFVAESPLDRRPILAFMQEAAATARAGARVLDAGAGRAPYGELFSHCEYVTADWASSPHADALEPDVVASLDSLPLDTASFDVVVNTQVLEHVADPVAVLAELHRVLVPGGRLFLTVPFVGELHEEPYDFYRYTRHGIARLLERAGFAEVSVAPVGGYFSAVAQLARGCGLAIGATTARSDVARRAVAAAGRAVARILPPLDRLDGRRALVIGYCCRAVRPADR